MPQLEAVGRRLEIPVGLDRGCHSIAPPQLLHPVRREILLLEGVHQAGDLR